MNEHLFKFEKLLEICNEKKKKEKRLIFLHGNKEKKNTFRHYLQKKVYHLGNGIF